MFTESRSRCYRSTRGKRNSRYAMMSGETRRDDVRVSNDGFKLLQSVTTPTTRNVSV